MRIDAQVKKIEDLKDYFFVVPDYQREYIWDSEKHVSRFMQDILDEFNPKVTNQSSYFIGSSIIVKRKDNFFDVVDGQQRLTTIIIVLCAIRNILSDLPEGTIESEEVDELAKIIQDLLYKYSIERGKKAFRLTLQYPESKDYLSKLIENKEYEDENTPSIIKMGAAYDNVFDFLNRLLEDNTSDFLKFIKYFMVNVELVIIIPDNIGSALKIFETINERGVGLNAMDLLKNLLFSHASEADFETIKELWRQMLETLNINNEGEKPLRFLRYFLIARYHDGIIREDDIYKWIISSEGKEKIKYEKYPVQFAKELNKAAVKYCKYIKATTSYDADAEFPYMTGIGYVAKRAIKHHLIVLMALKDNFDNADVNLLAKNLETLFFFYSANNILTKYYEYTLTIWAQKLRKIKTSDALRKFILEDIGAEVKSRKDSFEASFAAKKQGHFEPLYRLKYILGQIEEFIRGNTNFPQSNISFYQNQWLEHILPQTAHNIPEDEYPEDWDYPNAVYSIGNLTLLEGPINQSLNADNDLSDGEWFEAKKEEYKKSNIILTSSVSGVKIGIATKYNSFFDKNLKSFDTWDKSKVATRQEMIKQLMLEVWKIYV